MIGSAATGPQVAQTGILGASDGMLRTRLLGPEDFDRLRALNDTVIGLLADPSTAVLESDAFLRAHLGPAGLTVGVEHGEELVGCAVLGLPSADDPYNFGFDIGADAAARATVAHLDGCLVLPPWRGRALQRRLALWRMACAENMGRSLILTMASPRNAVSLRNLLGAGLSIVGLKPKFGGHLRFILARTTRGAMRPEAGPKLSHRQGADATAVPLDDLDGHLARLAAGERGVAFLDREGVAAILYRHPRVAPAEGAA